IKEGVAATDPDLSSLIPLRLPVGDRYGSNLVNAIESPFFYGLPATGSAQLFRYLGVRDVVLQNDIDWQHAHTVRPISMQTLLHQPDLNLVASYGRPGQNVVDPAAKSDVVTPLERRLPPIQILSVADARPIVRAETGPPIVLSGDGFGISGVATQGLLPGTPPLLYSGTLTPAQLARLLSEHAGFVITDSNRRRVWSFTGAR